MLKTLEFNGARLKELRTKAGLTQREAAEKLDVGYSTYNRYESQPKRFRPSTHVMERMAELFNCTIDLLVLDSGAGEKSTQGATLLESTLAELNDRIDVMRLGGMDSYLNLQSLNDVLQNLNVVLNTLSAEERLAKSGSPQYDGFAFEAAKARLELTIIDARYEIEKSLFRLQWDTLTVFNANQPTDNENEGE